jgi:hypothetical protein
MDEWRAWLSQAGPASRLLGWLNFSDGRPDPKWQRQLDDTYAQAVQWEPDKPWPLVRQWLTDELDRLERGDSAAFRDSTQARAALRLIFDHALPAYRRHHADLLGRRRDDELFTAFFVARVAEAILHQGPPWEQTDRIVRDALQILNDFVGYRPIAVLETRPQTDFYPHEKIRPVPIYLRGAGVAKGPYHDLIEWGLKLLRDTDPDLLHEACFDPELLDELAYDPRPIDHSHPVTRRPNYLFGEWDPHQVDSQGRYRRFVVRKRILDDILSRVPDRDTAEATRAERLFEAAAVFAGTVLMASGTCGSGPNSFDSTVTLSKLVPRIARYRDAFYKRLIASVSGEHGKKLRDEAARLQQPFGAVRQHINQRLARQRAIELQESRLALIFAEMGYPEVSRRHAQHLESVAVRFQTEIRLRLTMARFAVDRADAAKAFQWLDEAEDLLHRGIRCGAIVDPWNALGFHGLFPLFSSREDSIHDPRLDELVETVGRMFHLYATTLSVAASAGDEGLRQSISDRLHRFAQWWDQHAVYEVSDLPRVKGQERADAAEHVARAMAGVRRSAHSGDLAYWRQHREGFRSPAAFAQVIDALLHRRDYRASLALLMTWLGESNSVPLVEENDSFYRLAERWLEDVSASQLPDHERAALVLRFLELLEANAEELWEVPAGLRHTRRPAEEDPFASAYEEVTFEDSTDDSGGGVLGEGPLDDFPAEEEFRRLEERLRFLTTVARLWQQSVPWLRSIVRLSPDRRETIRGWQQTGHHWQPALMALLDEIHALKVPEPVGGFEEVMEYDRRQFARERLAEAVIETSIELSLAVRQMGPWTQAEITPWPHDAAWEPIAQQLEADFALHDSPALRMTLARLMRELRDQPLLFVPMSAGGHPSNILQSRRAQAAIRSLLQRLPRRGLIRETFHLIQLARTMEQTSPPQGRKVSEFDHLFPTALQAVLEALLDAVHSWSAEEQAQHDLVDLLRRILEPFLNLWLEHSQSLRLSVLESPPPGWDWDELHAQIRRYGTDLFTPQFLSLAHLRTVLHRGVETWLRDQANRSDAPRIVEDFLEARVDQKRIIVWLEYICHALIEHHEEYRDYNSTTTQSDYGENLHLLLEFLRLKCKYERFSWQMRPLVLAHEVLCRRGQDRAAEKWHENMAAMTRQLADQLLAELDQLEQRTGLRLRTIRDRLEERFVRPLLIDRLVSCVEPAMSEAARASHTTTALARLEQHLAPLTHEPIGIGLDLPEWLERLEEEVRRVAEKTPASTRHSHRGLDEGVRLSYSDLQQQLAEWNSPLPGAGPR